MASVPYKIVLSLCLCSALFLSCFFAAKRALHGSVDNQKVYDVFFLSIKNSRQDSWVIHGLWPMRSRQVQQGEQNTYKYRGVVDCKGGPVFDTTQITPSLRQQLEAAWPSADGGAAQDFWRHEYRKHGMCCTDLLPDSLQYLTKTLELWKPLQLHEVMGSDAPLKPGVFYPTTEIHSCTSLSLLILVCLAFV